MHTLIIGDIHGCFTELQELLAKAALTADDAVIALGDVVDRGPDSPRVLDFFLTQPQACTLMGNHERKHVRAWQGATHPALSQRITRRQFGEERYPAAVAAMATLPHFLELPEAVLVHAFWEPNVPLAEQRETVIVGTMSGEKYLMQHYDRPWYELYAEDKPIVVGHRDYRGTGEPFVYRDRVFGLDTGCYFGRALTGLLLPEFRLLSVPSRKNYWAVVKQQNVGLHEPATSEASLPWEKLHARLATVAQRPHLPCTAQEHVAHLQSVAEMAERALEDLWNHLVQEHERVQARVRSTCAFDALSPQEQGRVYAAHLGRTPLATLLHMVRKSILSRDTLRQHFKTPGDVFACLRRLGVWHED